MEKSEKRKAVAKYLIKDISLFALVVIYAVVMNLIFGYSCPLKILFDIDCPFCGMTRAHFAALRFDLKGALEYHSLFFLGLPYLYILTHEELFKGKAKRIYMPTVITLTALFVIRYVIVIIN